MNGLNRNHNAQRPGTATRRRQSTGRRLRLAAMVIGVVGTLMLASPVAAAVHCTPLTGSFTSVVVADPCASPIGLCTRGLLTGDLEGTYDATFATLVPAGDPTDPLLIVYTGTSVITLSDHGRLQLFGLDTGFIRLNPAGPSPFQTTVRVTGGTQRYRHASGGILAIGGLDLFTGTGTGTYSGEIC